MKMVAVRNCHLHLIRAEVLSLVVLPMEAKRLQLILLWEEASTAEIVFL